MSQVTPLYSQHQLAGAKLVDFHGWQMPLHYGSQLQEHNQVRQDAGLFDVSHMTLLDVMGSHASDYLRYLLTNDIAKLKQTGSALYSCMLNLNGGVMDDLIAYKLDSNHYRLVFNASTREKVWAWLQTYKATFDVQIQSRADLAMLAIQGPQAIAKMAALMPADQHRCLEQLRPFCGTMIEQSFYSRTGYTGEDGLEIQMPVEQVADFWQKLIAVGIKPCGLGARDTLRLEAGLALYGADMDEMTTPLEANLAWTVAFDPLDRQFVGRSALEMQKKEGHAYLTGIILSSGHGVLRSHQKIITPEGVGELTSGTFSPTLGYGIGLARFPKRVQATVGEVEIRQKRYPVHLVRPPFVRHGKKVSL